MRSPLSLTNARIKLVNTGGPSLNWIYGFSSQTSRIAERVSIICHVACARLKALLLFLMSNSMILCQKIIRKFYTEMDQSCSSSYTHITINFCIALGRQLWRDFKILNGIVALYIFMYACTYVRTVQSFKCFLCHASHCLPNQVWSLDHYSLAIGEPSISWARHALLSLFEIWEYHKHDIRFFSRESMAYFPSANARTSEITFQRGIVDTVTSRYSAFGA